MNCLRHCLSIFAFLVVVCPAIAEPPPSSPGARVVSYETDGRERWSSTLSETGTSQPPSSKLTSLPWYKRVPDIEVRLFAFWVAGMLWRRAAG